MLIDIFLTVMTMSCLGAVIVMMIDVWRKIHIQCIFCDFALHFLVLTVIQAIAIGVAWLFSFIPAL